MANPQGLADITSFFSSVSFPTLFHLYLFLAGHIFSPPPLLLFLPLSHQPIFLLPPSLGHESELSKDSSREEYFAGEEEPFVASLESAEASK